MADRASFVQFVSFVGEAFPSVHGCFAIIKCRAEVVELADTPS